MTDQPILGAFCHADSLIINKLKHADSVHWKTRRSLLKQIEDLTQQHAALKAEHDNDTKSYQQEIKNWYGKVEALEADNAKLKSILHDFHARMADTYDGAPDSNNRMPFSGSDLDELGKLLNGS